MAEPLRILILEDNPADAELAQFELQEAGFVFTSKVVMTEEDFVRELQEFSPDLILSDYDLPKYNGALALAEARRRSPDTPFILVSGVVTEDRAIEILTQGAQDYVLKNRLQQRLVPAVKRALAEAEEHRARKRAEAELREAHRTLEENVKVRTAELEAEMAARQDSEKRYRRLFEAAKDGILILDADTGKIEDVNPFLLQLLGYSYDDLYGKHIWELGVFKDIAASKEAFKALQDYEYIRYDDLLLETRDGQSITVEFVSNVYLVDHHKVIQCNIRDITEHKKIEDVLRVSEERFSKAFKNSPNAITITRISDGKIIEGNDSVYDLLGYDHDEVVGKTTFDLGIWANADERVKLTQGLTANGSIRNQEFTLLKKDKTPVIVDLSASLINIENQQCFLTSFIDITERKEVEAELHRLNEELEQRVSERTADVAHEARKVQAERQRFRDVLDILPAYVILLTPDYRVPFANRFFDERFGKSEGRRCFEYLFGRTEPCETCETYTVLKTGQRHEWEWLGPDGRNYYIFDFPFTDADGNPFVLEMGIDVTENKRTAKELEAYRHHLEELVKERTSQIEAVNRDLESFSYSVSHDLRAPLRAINGYSRMILKKQGAQFDEETGRRFQKITDNAEKMGFLIDDLLAFSRLGSQDVDKASLDMEELIGEAWQELIAVNLDREVTLKIGQMPAACGDKALIRQVYSNLLGNAVKFTREREHALIEAGSCTQDNETVYYVRDNGIGFDMRFYYKLFGVFQRLHSDEEYKGTGIGLSLVKRIINRHGGRVWGEGEGDKGATFYFTLPTPQE
jgi:PAS domain S-box-containing protein